MPRYSPLYQQIMAFVVPSIHIQFSGSKTFKIMLTNIREEGCDDNNVEDMYACMVRNLQMKESQARVAGEGIRKATNGAKQGLQVILDQHSNLDGVATHFDNDNSFKVFVGQPAAFPMLTSDPLTLSTGKANDTYKVQKICLTIRSSTYDPAFGYEFE